MAAVQMLDVHFPTTDGRMLILSRYTELNADQKLLLKQLKLDFPPQPPPRITFSQRSTRPQFPAVETFDRPILILFAFSLELRKLG
jgi:hypothetical protein